jgi:hypothetical protein
MSFGGGFEEGLLIMMTALVITIFLELIVAKIVGYRTKKELATVLLINLITNPVANLLFFIYISSFAYTQSLSVLKTFSSPIAYIVVIVMLEILVIISEWKLLTYALNIESKKALKLSLWTNLVSIVIGLPLIAFFSVLFVFAVPILLILIIVIILLVLLGKKSDSGAVLPDKNIKS